MLETEKLIQTLFRAWVEITQRIPTDHVTSYNAYLKSRKWKAICVKVKTRDGHRCRLCNVPEGRAKLEVHHRTYERLGDEDLNDLTTLCETCHRRFHASATLFKDYPFQSIRYKKGQYNGSKGKGSARKTAPNVRRRT